MKQYINKLALGLACVAMSHSVAATGLKISALQQGVAELDLFSTAASGAYVMSINPSTLKFPINIIEDRNGGFVIKLDGKKYYVGAADVITNKVYEVTASCDNGLTANPNAATRGIAGKGC